MIKMNEERNLTIEEETNGNNIDMNSLFGTAAKHGDKLTAEYSDGVEYEAATEEAAEMDGEEYCGATDDGEEDAPKDEDGFIIGTEAQKQNEQLKAFQKNIDDILHGRKPKMMYNPENGRYEEHPEGVPGAEDLATIVSVNQFEELAMIEYVRDYKQRHGGRFYQFDDLLKRRHITQIIKDYTLIYKLFFNGYNNIWGDKQKPPKLSWQVIFLLIMNTGDVGNMQLENVDAEVLGYYQHTGEDAGIWKLETGERRTWAEPILKIGRLFGISERNYEDLVHKQLQAEAPRHQIKHDVNLVPAANGVVDIRDVKPNFKSPTQWEPAAEIPFIPNLLEDGTENPEYLEKYKDKYFTYKLGTKWNPNAKNIDLNDREPGYIWSVDKHLKDVTEDGANKNAAILAIWELINACIRGAVLDHSPILCDGSDDQEGGGGKSSILFMIERTIGVKRLYIERSLDTICSGERFSLPGFDKGILCILSPETESKGKGRAIKATAIWKALFRADGQTIFVEAKGIDGKDVELLTQYVLACNTLPVVDSEDDAIWRNIILIIFPHNFATLKDENGKDVTRKYINKDYINREEVREYVLYKALSLGAVSDINAEAVQHGKDLLDEKRGTSDSVRTFLKEFLSRLKGDKHSVRQAFQYYHDIWSRETGHKLPVAEDTFLQKLKSFLHTKEGSGWILKEATSGTKISKTAPAERYLGRLYEFNIGDIRDYIDGTNALGEGLWKFQHYEGAKSRFYGLYLERTSEAATIEPQEMTPEQEDEAIAAYNAGLLLNAWGTGEPVKVLKPYEWIAKGKPLTKFYTVNGLSKARFTMTTEPTTEAATTTA